MRLKPSKATLGLLGGALAVILLVTGGVCWLLAQRQQELAALLEQKQKELDDGEQLARRVEIARAALERDREQLRFLEQGVPDAAYVPTLLKQIEDLGVSTRNRVIGVRPQLATKQPTRIEQRRDPEALEKAEANKGNTQRKAEPEEPYTPLQIQVNIVGTFESARRFVERLMYFPKIVAVDQVSIQPHARSGIPEPGARNLLDVEIRLTAFIMKEQTPAGPELTAIAAAGGTNP